MKVTFNQPISSSSPAGADSEVGGLEAVGIDVAHERLVLTLFSHRQVSWIPSVKIKKYIIKKIKNFTLEILKGLLPDPESTELAVGENVGGVDLSDVGLRSVLADDGPRILPASDEDLIVHKYN